MKNNSNDSFYGEFTDYTVSYKETGKKKILLGVIASLITFWLVFIGYDRLIRVNTTRSTSRNLAAESQTIKKAKKLNFKYDN